jgi:hypothetical protein
MNCSFIFKSKRQIHCLSFFLFFSLTIKDKTKISHTIKILHLGQGSFTRKVRTIFTLKIIVSIFVKLFLILVLHLRQFFIIRIFVKRTTGWVYRILVYIFRAWLTQDSGLYIQSLQDSGLYIQSLINTGFWFIYSEFD